MRLHTNVTSVFSFKLHRYREVLQLGIDCRNGIPYQYNFEDGAGARYELQDMQGLISSSTHRLGDTVFPSSREPAAVLFAVIHYCLGCLGSLKVTHISRKHRYEPVRTDFPKADNSQSCRFCSQSFCKRGHADWSTLHSQSHQWVSDII